MKLSEHALSAAPLLQAVAAGGDLSNAALAEATGRDARNMTRDLTRLAEAGWISRERGSPPALTDEGREILAALARAEGGAQADAAAVELPLHLIDDNPENPRTTADDEADEELTASIGKDGVLQPIMVRPAAEPGRYVVVMGARRRRCALAAGKLTIPAVIRDLDDAKAFEIATIENLQRADMNPLDEAQAFKRILDDRLAADPALKLKDAKEVIAQATGKTVRFVELRLQLLTLPAVKQVEIAEGRTTAKEAIKWIREQPKPLSLPPEHWLVALEVFDRALRFPLPRRHEHEDPATEVGKAANGDLIAETLRYPSQLLAWVHELEDDENYGLGRWALRPGWAAKTQLRLRFGDVSNEEVRLKALAEIRAEAGVEFALAMEPGDYATPWLNGPFEPDAARLAEVAAEREEMARQRTEHEEREAAEEAQAEAKEAAGRSRLTAAIALGEHIASKPLAPLDPLFAKLINDGGKPLPWWPSDNGEILAANGEPVLHSWAPRQAPPDTVARVRLITIAVNAAAGLATPTTPPAPPAEEAVEPEIEDEQPFVDEPADEDEDDLEDATAEADDEDQALPGFLRRLAGAGEAEARP